LKVISAHIEKLSIGTMTVDHLDVWSQRTDGAFSMPD
jgi:hypothetical protein